MQSSRQLRVLTGIAVLLCTCAVAPGSPRGQSLAAARQLQADVPGEVEVLFDEATGTARLVRLAPPGLEIKARSQTAQALRFFSVYPELFGLVEPAKELLLLSRSTDDLGLSHLSFQQLYRGVPVYAGVLRSHFDQLSRLVSVNGTSVAASTPLEVVPSLRAERANEIALQAVGKRSWGLLETGAPRLLVLATGLTRGIQGRLCLVWEVPVSNPVTTRELVYVDAHTGAVVDTVSAAPALMRRVFLNTFDNLMWTEGDAYPYAADPDLYNEEINRLIDTAGDVFALFSRLSGGGFLSWDGVDGPFDSVFASDEIEICPNAMWFDGATHFCSGMTTDDIAAHEWTHAYTEATHNLVYAWQQGALNEAFSDIFGETVDLLNDTGVDEPDLVRDAPECSGQAGGTVRWLIGEDSVVPVIRDMWMPSCAGQPGKVTDLFYHCGDSDSGGVHTNSGIPDHAFALLVDGGQYNDQSVVGIGLTKAASIYWRAMSVYQVPTTDFADHADLLELSCQDLVDAPLSSLEDGSTEVITAQDCDQLASALKAVDMRASTLLCGYRPLLSPGAPAAQGQIVVFAESFADAGIDGWTMTHQGSFPEFVDRDWVWTDQAPRGVDGGALFGVADAVLGDCSAGNDQSGVLSVTSPVITLSRDVSQPQLVLDHYVNTEEGVDGGNLKISVDGEPFVLVPTAAFTFNGYTTTLVSTQQGNTDPLAGEPAFSGHDDGTAAGSWGQSQLSLAALVGSGDSFQIRFDLGVDGCNGAEGWYLDNLVVLASLKPRHATRR